MNYFLILIEIVQQSTVFIRAFICSFLDRLFKKTFPFLASFLPIFSLILGLKVSQSMFSILDTVWSTKVILSIFSCVIVFNVTFIQSKTHSLIHFCIKVVFVLLQTRLILKLTFDLIFILLFMSKEIKIKGQT